MFLTFANYRYGFVIVVQHAGVEAKNTYIYIYNYVLVLYKGTYFSIIYNTLCLCTLYFDSSSLFPFWLNIYFVLILYLPHILVYVLVSSV